MLAAEKGRWRRENGFFRELSLFIQRHLERGKGSVEEGGVGRCPRMALRGRELTLKVYKKRWRRSDGVGRGKGRKGERGEGENSKYLCSPCTKPVAIPWGGVRGDLGVLSPDAVRGERGGEPSEPPACDVLPLPRSSFPSWGMGEEPTSTPRSERLSSRAHVTMSVLSSKGRGNLPPVQ